MSLETITLVDCDPLGILQEDARLAFDKGHMIHPAVPNLKLSWTPKRRSPSPISPPPKTRREVQVVKTVPDSSFCEVSGEEQVIIASHSYNIFFYMLHLYFYRSALQFCPMRKNASSTTYWISLMMMPINIQTMAR